MLRKSSQILGLLVVPLIFDLGCAEPLAPKLSVWLLASALALLVVPCPAPTPVSEARERGWGWRALGLWVAWMVLSTVWHQCWNGSAWLLTVLCAVLWRPAAGPGGWKWVLGGFALTALYSWIQRTGLDPFPWSHPLLSRERTIAGFGNPNYLAMYLACLLPLAWWWSYRRSSWLCAGCWFACLALLLTATRGAMLALALVLVLTSIFCWRRVSRRFWVVTWVAWIAAWAVVLQIPRSRGSVVAMQVQKVGPQDSSVRSRVLLWQVALRLGLENPVLGVGPGKFGNHYLARRSQEPESVAALQRLPEDPHSEPLRVLAETGVVGLVLWTVWVLSVFLSLVRARQVAAVSWAVLWLNSATNCIPLALWPVLIWMTALAEPGWQRPWNFRAFGRAALAAALLALAACTWYVQRQFWWDDEFAILGTHEQTAVGRDFFARRRLLLLRELQRICPPYYRSELARRLSLAEVDWWRVQSASGVDVSSEPAVAWAQRRIELEPDNPYAHEGLALIYEATGRWEEAETAWRRAHGLDPLNPAMLFFWGRALARVGKIEQALQRLQESLEINSKSAQVYQLRAQIMIEQGQTWEGYWDWVRGCQYR